MNGKKHLRFSTVSKLWIYISAYKWRFIIAIVLTIISNLLALLGPILSGYAIDAASGGIGAVNFERVFFYCKLMALFYVVSAILSYILTVLMSNISRKIVFKMREDVFNKLSELPISYFDKNKTGDIISKITYDIDTVNASLSGDLIQIFTSIITIIGSLIMMIVISPVMVSIFILTIPLSIFLTRFMVRKFRPLFRRRSLKAGELNGFVEEIIAGGATIKAYNREESMTLRFDKKNEETIEAYYEADANSSMTGPTVNFINNISLSLISTLGAFLFLNGRISLGNLSSFVLYSRKFSGPINEAANIIGEFQSAFSAAERVFDLLEEEVELKDVENAVSLSKVSGDVSVNEVSFGYTNDNITIKNLSFEAPKGSLIAVVGPTGAGKTTLINLLMRFYDTNAGQILLDKHEIRSLKRKGLRLAYSMVLQDTWLFNGTIYDNLVYGNENATKEEVENVAKTVKIHNYIMSLPEGYNTILNGEGVNISQGQKQLLTIARAMLMNTEMLILDEATSNVDTRTEKQIQDAMRKLMQNKTCFVIAHRLSTIKNADTIIVIDKGEIIEKGSHEELISINGLYAKLHSSQFET